VTDKGDGRFGMVPKLRRGHQLVEKCRRGHRDRPACIPGRFVGRIAERIDGCALNLLADPARPEIVVMLAALMAAAYRLLVCGDASIVGPRVRPADDGIVPELAPRKMSSRKAVRLVRDLLCSQHGTAFAAT
jgi:hypothetical protein